MRRWSQRVGPRCSWRPFPKPLTIVRLKLRLLNEGSPEPRQHTGNSRVDVATRLHVRQTCLPLRARSCGRSKSTVASLNVGCAPTRRPGRRCRYGARVSPPSCVGLTPSTERSRMRTRSCMISAPMDGRCEPGRRPTRRTSLGGSHLLTPSCPHCHRIDRVEEKNHSSSSAQWFVCTRCDVRYQSPPRP